MSWLDELKVGDEVIIIDTLLPTQSIKQVLGRTDKGDIVAGWPHCSSVFHRRTGKGISRLAFSCRLQKPTPKNKANVERWAKREGFRRRVVEVFCNRQRVENLSTEVLEKVVELISEVKQ